MTQNKYFKQMIDLPHMGSSVPHVVEWSWM